MIQLVCQQCGKFFQTPITEIRRQNRPAPKFCSKPCYHTSRINRIILSCVYCGQSISMPPMRVKRSKFHFCSKSCKSKYLNPILFTGTYRKKRYPIADKSLKWNGGVGYYGPDWDKIRKQAKKAVNYTCDICGKKAYGKRLQVHHRISFEQFGWRNHKLANADDNLQVVCTSCHAILHNKIQNLH